MMIQQSPELFAQRPVRSDYSRRKNGLFTLRRVLVLIVLMGLAVAGGYLFNIFGGGATSETPEAIPTIEAELPIKERPENPGGVDIPHQDVAVFGQLDEKQGNPTPQSGAEQLLPAPETPQQTPEQPAPQATEQTAAPAAPPKEEALPPAVTEAEAAPATPVSAAPVVAPAPAPKKEATAAVVKPAPKKEAQAKPTSDQVKAEAAIAKLPKELFTTGEVPAPAPAPVATQEKNVAPSGKMAKVQLASFPSEEQAQREINKFSVKYGAALGGAALTVVRADLAKGTYYRIMSAPMDEAKAKAACASVIQLKGACILAR